MNRQESEQDLLDKVAQAISNGEEVEWNALRGQSPGLGQRLERMRWIQTIAQLCQGANPHQLEDHEGVEETLTNEGPLPAFGSPVSAQKEQSPEGAADRASAPQTRSKGRPDHPIPRKWGHLEVVDRISSGGFGEVFRAYDPTLQREVALKLALVDRDTALAKRSLEEARKLARIRHPNFLVVHGAEEHDGRPGIWTDLIRGKTLAEQFRDQGALSAQEAAGIGIHLCQALAALHGAGLVHRDIKPQNVMREEGGRLVLLDFGCVDAEPPESATTQGTEGTPLFMAPEVFLRGEPARATADLYSLGALLFWLVSGKYPVQGRTLEELWKAHKQGKRQHLREVRPDLPLPFVRIVERCLDVEPAKRFRSVGELEGALADFSGQERLPTPTRIPWYRVRRLLLVAVALVLLVSAGLAIRLRPLDVEVELYRRGEGTLAALTQGDRISPKDRLFLEIRGSRPFFAYVFNEDDYGNRFVLFPSDSSESRLLQAGITHRLPREAPGESRYWAVSRVGGKERILVLASRERLVGVEDWIHQVPRVSSRLRSMNEVVEEEASDSSSTPGTWTEQIVEFLKRTEHGGRSPLIWRLEVENVGQ